MRDFAEIEGRNPLVWGGFCQGVPPGGLSIFMYLRVSLFDLAAVSSSRPAIE